MHRFALLIILVGFLHCGDGLMEDGIVDDDWETNGVSLRHSKMTRDDPPPPEDAAKMARYVLHSSNWTSVASISTRKEIAGYPFSNVFSVSDGANLKEASGIPYFYLSRLEMTVQDWQKNNQASMSVSLAQGEYCDANNLDPEDPRCAHVIFTGRVQVVKANSTEEAFARNALFKRHPEMSSWPDDHGWFFAKMNMTSIIVLDYFGGVKPVAVKDYFNADIWPLSD